MVWNYLLENWRLIDLVKKNVFSLGFMQGSMSGMYIGFDDDIDFNDLELFVEKLEIN